MMCCHEAGPRRSSRGSCVCDRGGLSGVDDMVMSLTAPHRPDGQAPPTGSRCRTTRRSVRPPGRGDLRRHVVEADEGQRQLGRHEVALAVDDAGVAVAGDVGRRCVETERRYHRQALPAGPTDRRKHDLSAQRACDSDEVADTDPGGQIPVDHNALLDRGRESGFRCERVVDRADAPSSAAVRRAVRSRPVPMVKPPPWMFRTALPRMSSAVRRGFTMTTGTPPIVSRSMTRSLSAMSFSSTTSSCSSNCARKTGT
jgi:hypothetical protein